MSELIVTAGEVTEMNQALPDSSPYDPDTVHIGQQPGLGLWRGLWRFPLTGLPASRFIHSATLRLNQFQASPTGGDVQLRLTTKSWVAGGLGASWNSYDVGKPWEQPGGDVLEYPAASAALQTGVLPSPAPLDVDVTVLVAASAGDELAFMMRVADEVNDHAAFTHFNTPDLLPTLTINYTAEKLNLLHKGAAWLGEQRHAHLSRPVVYCRGSICLTLKATVGHTEFEQSDQYGTLRRTQSRDYLIRAEDLVIAGAQVLPQAGDRILETQTPVVYIHEVMAPGGEPPWRYSDPYRRTLRIHTKHIATEATT